MTTQPATSELKLTGVPARIYNRMWFLHVGRIESVNVSTDYPDAYKVVFAHGVPNEYALKRITDDGFKATAIPVNQHVILTPPARWQTTPAPQPVTAAPVLAVEAVDEIDRDPDWLVKDWQRTVNELSSAQFKIAALTDTVTALTLRAELAERKLAALERERAVTTLPVSEVVLPNAELKKWHGERVVISRLLPPRRYSFNDKHDRFTAVFDADGVEGWAAVFPEVVDMLVKDHGYTSTRIRASRTKDDGLTLTTPLTGILEWNDGVGLKLVSFDAPEGKQNVA